MAVHGFHKATYCLWASLFCGLGCSGNSDGLIFADASSDVAESRDRPRDRTQLGIDASSDLKPSTVDVSSGDVAAAPVPDASDGSPTMAPDAADAPMAAPDVAVSPGENGAACAKDSECKSGFCTDGSCCDARCSETCKGCSKVKTGQPNGSCKVALDNTPCGQSSCRGTTYTGPPVCQAGRCTPVPPALCPNGLQCDAGGLFCKNDCQSSGDCQSGQYCQSGKCQPSKANGDVCDIAQKGTDCKSGACVDGVCCDSKCDGTCRGCIKEKTGKASGLCGFVLKNTPCGAGCCAIQPGVGGRCQATCDGAGVCKIPTSNVVVIEVCQDSNPCSVNQCVEARAGEAICVVQPTQNSCSSVSGKPCCCPKAAAFECRAKVANSCDGVCTP